MATYKVLQDIEAEDKLVGPLTLWQFIYALIAGLCMYLSAISVMKGVPYILIFLVPIGLFVGFLAIPWVNDQPTEVWALAKLRFFLKPRRRIWDQTGMTELVTVTAPKHEERFYTDGLSQREVNSRLHALASTLDSRGWAVKNVNVNVATMAPSYTASDRLIDVSTVPDDMPAVDIRPDDDMLDEQANPVAHTFETMIDEAASEYHKALIDRMNQPLSDPAQQAQAQNAYSNNTAVPQPVISLPTIPDFGAPTFPSAATPPMQSTGQAPLDFWFTQQPATTPDPMTTSDPAAADPIFGTPQPVSTIPQAADPTAEESEWLSHLKAQENQQNATYDHLKTLKTPEQLEEEARAQAEAQAAAAAVTSEKQAAIMNLSRSNDLNIDTLARQAKQTLPDDDEVVITLR